MQSLSSSSSSAAAVIALNLKDANWWLDVNESPFWQDRILRILAGLYGIVSVTVIAVVPPSSPTLSFRYSLKCAIGEYLPSDDGVEIAHALLPSWLE
ncbi:hypothetical protein Bca4012_096714 [Brassica carinata]